MNDNEDFEEPEGSLMNVCPDKFDIEKMKIKINTFLWENLPDNATIKNAEAVSLVFLECMIDAWEAEEKPTYAKPSDIWGGAKP